MAGWGSAGTALTLAKRSQEESVDGKVSLTIANELAVPVQLRYYWKGELVPNALATIKLGKTKSMSTKHGVQWQVSGDGAYAFEHAAMCRAEVSDRSWSLV